jgi:hypothetical protein
MAWSGLVRPERKIISQEAAMRRALFVGSAIVCLINGGILLAGEPLATKTLVFAVQAADLHRMPLDKAPPPVRACLVGSHTPGCMSLPAESEGVCLAGDKECPRDAEILRIIKRDKK